MAAPRGACAGPGVWGTRQASRAGRGPLGCTSPVTCVVGSPRQTRHGRRENDAHRGTRLLALLRNFSPKKVSGRAVFFSHFTLKWLRMRLAKTTDNGHQLERLALSVLRSDIACTSCSPRSEEPAFLEHAIKKIGRLIVGNT